MFPMLTYHRRPVALSLLSTDLPILSTIETAATLYQKEDQRFHLLLSQSDIPYSVSGFKTEEKEKEGKIEKQLIWLEISPYRVIMTMQSQGQFAYRHFWEQGVYGISRYWFNDHHPSHANCSFRLRNYTRNLKLEGKNLPEFLRIEYELWTGDVYLGHYVLHLEIFH